MPGVADGLVARPYGYAALEEMDSYGGWIGTPTDYLKFLLAIDGQRRPRLLSDASVREMLSRPTLPGADPGRPLYYALGVKVPQAHGRCEELVAQRSPTWFLRVRAADGPGTQLGGNL